MKSLTFAFTIAFIFEDYGTFQGRLIEKNAPIERVELFKKYALELVNAAIPVFRNNEEIMDGGCGCMSGVNLDENASPFDVILAIVSTAKHYYSDLQVIRQSPNLSDIEIKDGLMENIRIIVVRLRSAPEFIRDINLDDLANKFLFKNKRVSSSAAAGTGDSNNDFESDAICFRSIISVCWDENNFTDKLFDGIDIVHALMRDDDKVLENDPRWTQLNTIIAEISTHRLRTVTNELARYFVVKYDLMLNGNSI